MSLRNLIASKVSKKAEEIFFHQEQPNTFIKMSFSDLEASGFAKVSWPDQWDAEFGQKLARNKAVYKLTRQILESDNSKYIDELDR